MDKYKIKRSNGVNKIVYRTRNEIQLNQEVINQVRTGAVSSLLPVIEANSREVVYGAGDLITLRNYLKKNVSIDIMYSIISQTIDTLNKLSNERMSNTRLVLDADYVFVNEEDGRLFFIYEPYISNREMIVYINFWINIIDTTKIKDVDVREQCLQLKQYIEESKNKSLDEIYAYVNKTVSFNNPSTTGNLMVKATNLREVEQMNQSFDEEPETGLLVQSKPEPLTQKPKPIIAREKRAFIIRENNNDKVEVITNVFSVGKSASCNYTISGNPTISRNHVIISKKLGEFYLVDEKSTNGTFINGEKVEKNREYCLKNGDRLRLSNEYFDVEIV